jgi:hypothetical protein
MLPELVGKISLRPHPARRRIHGIMVEAFPHLRMIMVNGQQAGYCWNEPNHPVTLIHNYPKEFITSITEYVESEVGGAVSRVGQPPTEDQIASVLEEARQEQEPDDDDPEAFDDVGDTSATDDSEPVSDDSAS